ncbi:F-box/RNI-like/FBD-like domains-containing protein [Rhynchospora pubera]|uniref:F-box/RNI-like/FBD-like domains-containing protein n=1 Tax=Rhynchospora pubera TaxID=906938 RepID=A0AAV8CD76_9POAL|nr:F-box/RNI-like/FBD-like domains-containing protein [Rhynchospora pubera]
MAEEVDRLSALPLDIKTSVLLLLPIEDAVRTSSLSHSWRHVWTHLSSLCFLLSFPDDPDLHLWWVELFAYIISSLRGPLIDFYLCYYAHDNEPVDLFCFLNLIFLKGGLQKLSIDNNGCLALIQLPYFRSLRVLYLCHLHLLLPDDFQGFEHLEDLSLYGVCISQKDIQLLIDSSKNLRMFQGHVDSDDANTLSLIFNSPLLSDIQYYFTDSVKQVRVINAPNLEKAHVSACIGATSSKEECALIAALTSKFMPDIAAVSDFELDFETIKCFSQDVVPCGLGVQFLQLRSLHLEGIVSTLDERLFATFCCLLKNMPILESLDIKCLDDPNVLEGLVGLVEPDAFKVNKCIKKADGISCLEQSLRRLTVSVTNSINVVAMGMIRFILLNANVIELVEIIYRRGNEVEPSTVEELNLVEKASPDVNLVFSSTSDWF